MSLLDTLITKTIGSVKGLPEHLQDTEKLGQLGLSSQNYNVISAMNAADNMNSGIKGLTVPAALYTIGDTIFNSNQSLPEGISDFGRYMKGVNIQSNPELAKQLMGENYVNQMQGKYALAMNEIGKGIFGKGPDPSIYGSPSNTGILSTSYTDRIIDPNRIPGRIQEAVEPQYRIRDQLSRDFLQGGLFRDAKESLGQSKDAFLKDVSGLRDMIGSGINKTKSGINKSFDLGKAAIGGIASLVTGIPGLGLLLNAFQETPEQTLMKDFYGSEFGLDNIGRVQSGIMAGYNPVSMFGSAGLGKSIDKRMATIRNTLKKKKSVALENRLKELQRIKDAEQKAREDRAREMQAQNRADNTGGYQAGYGRDFMDGPSGTIGGQNQGLGGQQGKAGGTATMGSS